MLSAWALPQNWRKGMRPWSRNGNSNAPTPSNGKNGRSQSNGSNSPKVSVNGHSTAGSADKANGDDLDGRILCMEKTVGTLFYRNICASTGASTSRS